MQVGRKVHLLHKMLKNLFTVNTRLARSESLPPGVLPVQTPWLDKLQLLWSCPLSIDIMIYKVDKGSNSLEFKATHYNAISTCHDSGHKKALNMRRSIRL